MTGAGATTQASGGPAAPPARRRSVARETWLALVASSLLATGMNWPAIRHPASTVPGDLGDPLLQSWELAWDGHALTHQPLHPFDSNTFYPLKNTLAFTDSLLGYAPLSWFGQGQSAALVRYNLVFVLVFALCGWGGYLLARQLGLRPGAAAITAAVFAYAPWRGTQSGHLDILSSEAVPIALALLARGHGLRSGRRGAPAFDDVRPAAIVGGWLVAAFQLTLGFGVGLAWTYLLALIDLATVLWWLRRGRPRLPRALLRADAAGAAVFALVGGLFALPYLRNVHDHPEARRTIGDLELFSPPLKGFFITPSTDWLWGARQGSARARLGFPPEMALAVGGTAVVLAVVGIVLGSWSWRRRWVLAASIATLALFATGTQGPDGGRFSYLVLFHHAPGWSGVRTPGRLVIPLTLALGLLAAQGAEAVTRPLRAVGVPPTATLLVLTVAVLLEGVSVLAHPAPPAAPVAALHTGTGPMLIIPDPEGTEGIAMWWTTDDFEPIANGTSGFYPVVNQAIRDEAAQLPTAPAFAELRGYGIRRIVAVLGSYGAASQQLLETSTLPDGVTRTLVGEAVVYQLR